MAYFRSSSSYTNAYVTNSLLISVTNYLQFNAGSDVIASLDDTDKFQAVGSASHYLSETSAYRNIGTTNINAALLDSLKQRTTYPPILLSNAITSDTILMPQAHRDTDLPDIGYEYDPVDWLVGGLVVSNASLSLSGGAVLAAYGNVGIVLKTNSHFLSQSSAELPNVLTRYNMAQEDTTTNWCGTTLYYQTLGDYEEEATTVRLRFTRLTLPAGSGYHIDSGDYRNVFTAEHCEFYSAGFRWEAGSLVTFTNCLLHRLNATIEDSGFPLTGHWRNNTFYGGLAYWNTTGTVYIYDNLFDYTTNTLDAPVTHNYNAYLTNGSRLTNFGANDIVLATNSYSYETNAWGQFYLPTNSPLINAGSTYATNVGLYHFTTTTNQLKEALSTVDLGFHFVALSNGAPVDTDVDGVADYIENAAGDGGLGPYERNWMVYDTDLNGDGFYDNNTNAILTRLGYWRFQNSTNLGENGEVPTQNYADGNPAAWSSNAVDLTTTYSRVIYRQNEYSGKANANFTCQSGSFRFWYRPHWTSSALGGIGPNNSAHLLEFGKLTPTDTFGYWGLLLADVDARDLGGNWIRFSTHKDGWVSDQVQTPIHWSTGLWHQVAFTYSPSNVNLYLDGRLAPVDRTLDLRPRNAISRLKTNVESGIFSSLPESARLLGMLVGQWNNNGDLGGGQATGDIDELETFNYPLSAAEIARDFPNPRGVLGDIILDTDYDGICDHLETYVYGTDPNIATSNAPLRLGYWRFNDDVSNLIGEQGQVPLLASNVNVTPSWSSNAVAFTTYPNSQLKYRDVETNGWANVNCRNGSATFWLKLDSPSISGELLCVGTTDSSESNKWELRYAPVGTYSTYYSGDLIFTIASNGVNSASASAQIYFTNGTWLHVALTYSPVASAIYTNGVLAASGGGATNYPALNFRTNGFAIGNNTVGSKPVGGQIDELETFNYPLTTNEIRRKFEAVNSWDNNLDGIPDVLQDLLLAVSVPFLGVPFVITGTIESEQFDRGGEGVAYHCLGSNTATNDYRASKFQIITNTTDRGAGFIVDNLRSNEWLKYTLDVRVAQSYAVDMRVAGIGTGGVFHVEFTNAATGAFTNTGPLTCLTTNWTNLTRTLLPLAAGTNVMKVVMDTNSASGAVCQLNYISIYPSWVEGVTNLVANYDVTNMIPNDSSWLSASNNAAMIRDALSKLDSLNPGDGGSITITAGTYYVTQDVVDEVTAQVDLAG